MIREEDILFDNKRQVIVLDKTINSHTNTKDVLSALEELFTKLNYTTVDRKGQYLVCANGNVRKNGWFNNPLKWENTFKFTASEEQVRIEVEWSVENQLVSKFEKSFIINFLKKLTSDMQKGGFRPDEYHLLVSNITKKGRKMTLSILLGMLLPLIVFLPLAFYFDSILFILLGVPLGAIVSYKYLIKKID